jgi:VanZ family protein
MNRFLFHKKISVNPFKSVSSVFNFFQTQALSQSAINIIKSPIIVLLPKKLKRSDISLPAAICWFIISTILLTLPGSTLPQENWMDKIWVDKWVHIGMFSLLTVLWCMGWRSLKKPTDFQKWKRVCIIIGCVWLMYGISMEFVQKYLIPNRSFDPGDILADAVGCTIGVIFSIKRYKKNRPL